MWNSEARDSKQISQGPAGVVAGGNRIVDCSHEGPMLNIRGADSRSVWRKPRGDFGLGDEPVIGAFWGSTAASYHCQNLGLRCIHLRRICCAAGCHSAAPWAFCAADAARCHWYLRKFLAPFSPGFAGEKGWG